jgi:hypothetical protein
VVGDGTGSFLLRLASMATEGVCLAHHCSWYLRQQGEHSIAGWSRTSGRSSHCTWRSCRVGRRPGGERFSLLSVQTCLRLLSPARFFSLAGRIPYCRGRPETDGAHAVCGRVDSLLTSPRALKTTLTQLAFFKHPCESPAGSWQLSQWGGAWRSSNS